jgi:hypothetical protein
MTLSVAIETLFAASQKELLPESFAPGYYFVCGAERPVFEQREPEIRAAIIQVSGFHEPSQLDIAAMAGRGISAPSGPDAGFTIS